MTHQPFPLAPILLPVLALILLVGCSSNDLSR
ncbi:MAG: hypothetical protein HW389_3015, partial [Bacteroidetes bacterium]|nr:hypothetical protein [Bacteroidota bacterium]